MDSEFYKKLYKQGNQKLFITDISVQERPERISIDFGLDTHDQDDYKDDFNKIKTNITNLIKSKNENIIINFGEKLIRKIPLPQTKEIVIDVSNNYDQLIAYLKLHDITLSINEHDSSFMYKRPKKSSFIQTFFLRMLQTPQQKWFTFEYNSEHYGFDDFYINDFGELVIPFTFKHIQPYGLMTRAAKMCSKQVIQSNNVRFIKKYKI